ncbi:MAG: hypothetical protein K0R54_2413 [Clostridiaceae bacterium]|nr:hypothetical protein [Clostridiaceae bacterium]
MNKKICCFIITLLTLFLICCYSNSIHTQAKIRKQENSEEVYISDKVKNYILKVLKEKNALPKIKVDSISSTGFSFLISIL